VREHESERGGYPRFHRGQPRRYSPSPEVRYRGGQGSSRVPLNGWDKEHWIEVRRRRGKASGHGYSSQDKQQGSGQQGGYGV